MSKISAYHNVSGSQHQARFNTLSKTGFRIISLSCYGDPGHALYAAVWSEESGPAWHAVHGKTAEQYQELFDIFTKEGYSSTIITVTGAGSDARFAGVFEKNGKAFTQRTGLKSITGAEWGESKDRLLQTWQIHAKQENLKLRWISTYGHGDDVRYAAIWQKETPPSYDYFGDPLRDHDGAAFQNEFDLRNKAKQTPALITVYTDDQWYSAIWYDSNPWGTWKAFHGLTSQNYQKTYDEMNKEGFHAVRVQGGGGTGSDIRFAAIFAK